MGENSDDLVHHVLGRRRKIMIGWAKRGVVVGNGEVWGGESYP